jgi:hypothetical protein
LPPFFCHSNLEAEIRNHQKTPLNCLLDLKYFLSFQVQILAATKHHRDPSKAAGGEAAQAEAGREALLQDGLGADSAQEEEEV